MEKIITDFPKSTARINCCVLIFDNPATTLITDEGENGKHKSKNNGPNPCRPSQLVTLSTCLFLLMALNIRLFPSLRIIKNIKIDYKLDQIKENKNTLINQYYTIYIIYK